MTDLERLEAVIYHQRWVKGAKEMVSDKALAQAVLDAGFTTNDQEGN